MDRSPYKSSEPPSSKATPKLDDVLAEHLLHYAAHLFSLGRTDEARSFLAQAREVIERRVRAELRRPSVPGEIAT